MTNLKQPPHNSPTRTLEDQFSNPANNTDTLNRRNPRVYEMMGNQGRTLIKRANKEDEKGKHATDLN